MVNVQCPACDYQTGENGVNVAVALLNAHVAAAHAAAAGPPRAPRVSHPELKDNITEETWNAFALSWQVFLRANNVPVGERSSQLLIDEAMPYVRCASKENHSVQL